MSIKSPFKPIFTAFPKYVTCLKARIKAQRNAKGTTAGPTGAQVDTHVASTLSRKTGATLNLQRISTDLDIPSSQVESEGRTLGIQHVNDSTLQDDPKLLIRSASARALTVPTTSVTDPALLQQVSQVTYGEQTSIPFLPFPNSTSNSIIDDNQYGFVDPRIYSGTSFDLVGNGLHEPLNIIISSISTASVLTRKGLQSYLRWLDFDKECFGFHGGAYQKAYVDLRGWRDQEFIYRQVYTPFDHVFGTCIESLVGGNHIRAWQQQGSGAWFLATSREMDANKNHMIVPNGYNLGRNQLVQKALAKPKRGKTSFMGTKYTTSVQFVAGLMPMGIQGVNHNIAVDGLTAVLTVRVAPEKSQSSFKQVATVNANGTLVKHAHVGNQGSRVNGTMAVAKDEEESKEVSQKGKQERTAQRRRSLAKRFSVSTNLRVSTEERAMQNTNKNKHVWSKFRKIATPNKQPTTLTIAEAGEHAAAREK
ncbi:uncharacterized protein MEPE_04129 [Melanopsichium pennsylvanicum]|uniref:Uncharacterized protein n=2 Tax=Melanopsichium pennsylvanicum TaxID=63383 RepID=A0AAJ4XNB8_9BASI|nr:conserved hypothetical protein [Melanopsichium pennsylvanicum 4]SNX85420.1 uncharacterized protein MEPE_04129 [Melanopsichium pennsylvanicum]